MAENEIYGGSRTTELANQMTKFEELLIAYGLPAENIIASIDERETIMSALPTFLNKIAAEEKRNEVIDYMLEFHNRKILNKVYKDQGFMVLSNGILKW